MDNRADIREFLASRRAKVTPEQVAVLAGVSTDWYTRLEKGHINGVCADVLDAVELSFEALDLPADPGLTLTAYTAEQGSPSEDALRLLASWAATAAPAHSETSDHTPTGKD